MDLYHNTGDVTIYHGRAINLLRWLDAGSVSLAFFDPPYKMRNDLWWDKQWKSDGAFLDWIGQICAETKRVLAANGSLYLCASPQMAYQVEGVVREHFNVLNVIRWQKTDGTFSRADVTGYRSWLAAWEAVIFAEQWGADGDAMNASGYETMCQGLAQRVFQISDLCTSHQVTRSQIGDLILDEYKNIESARAQASNWILGKNIPNQTDFEKLKTVIPIIGNYDDLRQEYEELRREYEELRREYEELRRPFYPTRNLYRDDWHYAQIEADDTKHPTEKPLDMLLDIVETSSRPGDLVLDCFLGRGTTAVAAQRLGRRFVGGDIQEQWCAATVARLREAGGEWHIRPRRPRGEAMPDGQLDLFEQLEEATG